MVKYEDLIKSVEISIVLHDGYQIKITLTDPLQMTKVVKLKEVWPALLKAMGGYFVYRRRRREQGEA